MKSLILIFSICVTSVAGFSQTIDLSKDPSQAPIISQKSNAQLLRESKPSSSTPAVDTSLIGKYSFPAATTTDTKNSSMFTNEDGQRNHTQQQQINIGNGGTKATNTIHYDNAGKVQGSGTSIQFGGKKK